MVASAEEYPYSSHRAYLGSEPESIVDVDPVLRLFGNSKEIARDRFREYVAAGIGLEYPEEFDSPVEGDILGSEEFVDRTIHRIGFVDRKSGRSGNKGEPQFSTEALVAALEAIFGVSKNDLARGLKNAKAVMAKEVLILIGRDAGASVSELAGITGIDTSSVSRRYDAAKQNVTTDPKLAFAIECVLKEYGARIAETHA